LIKNWNGLWTIGGRLVWGNFPDYPVLTFKSKTVSDPALDNPPSNYNPVNGKKKNKRFVI